MSGNTSSVLHAPVVKQKRTEAESQTDTPKQHLALQSRGFSQNKPRFVPNIQAQSIGFPISLTFSGKITEMKESKSKKSASCLHALGCSLLWKQG